MTNKSWNLDFAVQIVDKMLELDIKTTTKENCRKEK